MKAESKPIVISVGLASVGAVGFALMQLMPFLTDGAKSPAVAAQAADPGVRQVLSAEVPAITTDPFRSLSFAEPIQASAVSEPTSPACTTAQSASVAPAYVPPASEIPAIEGEIGGTQTMAKPLETPRLILRAVIDTRRPEAYISVTGKPAKPFSVGAELLPGVHVLSIQPSFVEVTAGEEILRLRVGQEVQL